MTPSKACLDLIKQFEGLSLDAYKCPAGVPTIGYGHTRGVYMGDRISQAVADQMLSEDVASFAKTVTALVVRDTLQFQFDALVSFAFNVGCEALKESTLLAMHNTGDTHGAAKQFARWNKAGGKELAGLTRRRAAEAALYRGEN